MGLETVVPRAAGALPLAPVLARLASEGFACAVLMVDGALVSPRAAPPEEWREVRLKTPGGMVTLARRPAGVALTVFGNADPGLVAAREKVAAALRDAA